MVVVVEEPEASFRVQDHENEDYRPTQELTTHQEEFCRAYVTMCDKVDAYQSVYDMPAPTRAWKKATSLLARPEVAAFVSKLRGKGPDLPSEETLILQKLLAEAKDGKLTHLERVRCMDLYVKTKRLLDLDDTNATDLPASIDQAIKDIKAGAV